MKYNWRRFFVIHFLRRCSQNLTYSSVHQWHTIRKHSEAVSHRSFALHERLHGPAWCEPVDLSREETHIRWTFDDFYKEKRRLDVSESVLSENILVGKPIDQMTLMRARVVFIFTKPVTSRNVGCDHFESCYLFFLRYSTRLRVNR